MVNIDTDELKKLVEKKKVIFGSSEVVKKIKQGKIVRVIIASNVTPKVEEDIKYNANFLKCQVEKIDLPNDELGIVFKRQHPIMALGVLKD
jgi:ribosomal protein L30E